MEASDDLHEIPPRTSEKLDCYAKLAGTTWTAIDGKFKPSSDIQSIIDATDMAYDAYKESSERYTYLSNRIRNHSIDISCFDIILTGSYLDVLLYHYREKGEWEEYKKYYDEGIQLMDHLYQIHMYMPSLRMASVICGIARTYESYQNVTDV